MKARDLFTVFVALFLLGAIVTSWNWPLRASIIILTLGTTGLVLISIQLVMDFQRKRTGKEQKLAYEIPTIQVADAKAARRGILEIWGWLIGLLFAIWLFGLPITLPAFVFIYAKFYGAGWIVSVLLAAFIGGFEYGIYEQIVHVYWPDPLILELFH